MSISRGTAIPTALMATLMACSSSPDQGEVVPVADQICGQKLYEPGTCEEIVPLKMAPEVEKLLCETADAIANPEKRYVISDEKGNPSDLFNGRFPKVTPATGTGNKVYQCGEDPETGDAACVKRDIKGAQGTINTFEVEKLEQYIEVEDGLAELITTNPKNQLTVGMLDGIAPVADDWSQPCPNREKTCSKPWPPEQCKEPFRDFVNRIHSGIHKIVGEHAHGKTDFAERRRSK